MGGTQVAYMLRKRLRAPGLNEELTDRLIGNLSIARRGNFAMVGGVVTRIMTSRIHVAAPG
jgi:hypothetical protein